jgi:hypothetical protein
MIEKQIADAALQQAKTILDNKDFWGGPGAANTSATTLSTLLGVAEVAGEIAKKAPAPVAQKEEPVKAAVKATEKPVTDGKPESAKP